MKKFEIEHGNLFENAFGLFYENGMPKWRDSNGMIKFPIPGKLLNLTSERTVSYLFWLYLLSFPLLYLSPNIYIFFRKARSGFEPPSANWSPVLGTVVSYLWLLGQGVPDILWVEAIEGRPGAFFFVGCLVRYFVILSVHTWRFASSLSQKAEKSEFVTLPHLLTEAGRSFDCLRKKWPGIRSPDSSSKFCLLHFLFFLLRLLPPIVRFRVPSAQSQTEE